MTSSVAVERIVPGQVQDALFREHEARYIFAGKFVRNKRVLDVACGTGIGTQFLLGAGACSCIGFDIDAEAVAYAKAAYKRCSFAQCDATMLCLPNSSVDVVVSFETIEHIRDQQRFLLECRRVLRPAGILICSTPNRAIIRWEGENPFHLRELSTAEFEQLLETIFCEVSLYAQNRVNYLPYITRRLVSRSIDRAGLKKIVKRVLRWEPGPLAHRTEFDSSLYNIDDEIQPYHKSLLNQPMYVVAVSHKESNNE
jgi:ubiquinone/menaquinone biosynthesis C-methylase UbiE